MIRRLTPPSPLTPDLAQVDELGPGTGFSGSATTRIDPEIARPYNWEYTASIQLPWDISVSGALQVTTGLPLQRSYTVTTTQVPGLTQVTQSVDLIPAGDVRLPGRALLDRRFARTVRMRATRLQALADIYNMLNSDATISEVQTVGPSLGRASEVVQGRLLRLGVQWNF